MLRMIAVTETEISKFLFAQLFFSFARDVFLQSRIGVFEGRIWGASNLKKEFEFDSRLPWGETAIL